MTPQSLVHRGVDLIFSGWFCILIGSGLTLSDASTFLTGIGIDYVRVGNIPLNFWIVNGPFKQGEMRKSNSGARDNDHA